MFQVAGIILLLSGIIGKFGAVLTLIPDPIIGGTLTVVFGMVGAVGISVLQFMDMSSTRNLTILALSMILGLMVPQWLLNNPNSINTGKVSIESDTARGGSYTSVVMKYRKKYLCNYPSKSAEMMKHLRGRLTFKQFPVDCTHALDTLVESLIHVYSNK